MTTRFEFALRPALAQDMVAITDIYRFHVLAGTGTFALEPATIEEMTKKWDEVNALGLPYLVAIHNDHVIGYAYASPFRERPAYGYGAEDSIYIDKDFTGQGVGKALLSALIAACRDCGLYQLYGVIGDSDNLPSIGLHKALGFEDTGRLPNAGYKFGRWLDVVFMSLNLRPLETPPQGKGWVKVTHPSLS